jgi:hypothetical protein
MVRAQGADLTASGSVNLADGAMDARLSLLGAAGTGALASTRPEIGITLKGPSDAPRRSIDVAALTSWLALRAVEQQSKKLELLEGREPASAPSAPPAKETAIHPAPSQDPPIQPALNQPAPIQQAPSQQAPSQYAPSQSVPAFAPAAPSAVGNEPESTQPRPAARTEPAASGAPKPKSTAPPVDIRPPAASRTPPKPATATAPAPAPAPAAPRSLKEILFGN